MKIQLYIFYTILLLIVMLLWEQAANDNATRVLIGKPTLIAKYFGDNYSYLLEATYITFKESVFGLILATFFSFFIMIFCLYFPIIMRYILPILVTSQVIPLITLAPLFIILFGVGIYSKVLMAALLCFFPIFVNFANGVRLINKNIDELLYIYNANKSQKIWYAYFPLALPNIMAGLRVAASLSVISAIVAEFNGAEIGLGKNLFLAAKKLEPELMMCSLFLSAIIGGILYYFIHFIETLTGKWYLQ